jgi:hypothetical protein
MSWSAASLARAMEATAFDGSRGRSAGAGAPKTCEAARAAKAAVTNVAKTGAGARQRIIESVAGRRPRGLGRHEEIAVVGIEPGRFQEARDLDLAGTAGSARRRW